MCSNSPLKPRGLLLSLAFMVANRGQNTQPYNRPALASGGFELKSESNPVGAIAAVRNLHQVVSKVIVFNKAKIA